MANFVIEPLLDGEERFRLLVEGVKDYAIMIVDTHGRIMSWNEGVLRLKGYTESEIVGRSMECFYPPEAIAAGTPARLLDLAAKYGRSEDEGWRIRKDGSRFYADVVLTPIRNGNGELVGFSKITRDITERTEMQRRLIQAQKMEAIGNLTSGMAHDFNNVLAIIVGNLDLVMTSLAAGTDAYRFADSALTAATNGADLIQRLLAFARRQPLVPRRFVLDATLKGMTELLQRTLGTQIAILLKTAPDLWPVMADPTQFEMSLVNMAMNARDAMPNGGRLTIAASNQHVDANYAANHAEMLPGDYVKVQITDTGVGIAQEVIDRIFDPFFTTKTRAKGTGLGLSMVLGFVKQSGGHINVYSEPGVGTTFRLYLPRAYPTEAEPTEPVGVPAKIIGDEIVLAVDDNPEVLRMTVRQLQFLGYSTIEARSAAEALEILGREHVDLLFTDVVMPGDLDGIGLARECQARWPAVKVLFTSGFPEDRSTGVLGKLPESAHLLTKPYRTDELAHLVRTVLDS